MGVCCSKSPKETGASSSRHYVAVNSSPSLIPTENGYGQDSTLARGIEETRSRLEKAVEAASVVDFSEKSSRSAFIETDCVDPTWETKHRLGEGKESWESLVHKPRWNAEWSEESSTENEDGDNKVIPLKPRCSGAMRRLKKKDSRRQPNYKDEIMLTDNIDSIVEKEIPEVPDVGHALAGSPGPSSIHASVLKPSPRRSKKTEDNKSATSVECRFNDTEPDARSNGTTVTSAVAAQGPKKIYAKRRSTKAGDKMLLKKEDVEERDVQSSPLAISSVSTSRLEENDTQRTMDEEDIRVAEEIKNILKDDCLNFSNEPTAPSAGEAQKSTRKGSARKEKHVIVPAAKSKGEIPAGRVSPPKNTQRPKKTSTMQKEITEEEKLVDDMEYILNDDIPAAESSGQNTTGRVSPSNKTQHPQEKCTGPDNNITEDEQLADDIEYILNDEIPVAESNGQNTTGRVSPKKKSSRDEKLAEDMDYILNDDIPATESNEFAAGRVSPSTKAQHPKKKTLREVKVTDNVKLADDLDYILSDGIPAAETNGAITSPKEKAQRVNKISTSDNKLKDDKNIATYVKDDIPTVEEVKSQRSSRKNYPKRKVSFQEPEQSDDNLAQDEQDGSSGKVTLQLGALPPLVRNHSKQADEQLAKDIEYILHEDDIFAVEPEVVAITSSPSELPRPKTSNPRLSLAMEMDRIFDPASIDFSDQADGTLAEDHEAVVGVSNTTMSPSFGVSPCPRKKTRRRKSKYMTIVEDVAEETDSNASVTSTSLASPLQNDFSLSSGTEKHQRTHCTRSKEITEDKAATKDRDHTLKEHLHPGKSLQPISSSSGSLPRRPKTRNPKRMLANNSQSSSSAACSSRAGSRLKQDYIRKPSQAPSRSAKDGGFVQGATSNVQMAPTACAAPRTHSRNNSTKNSNDSLILEDVDTGEQITSSSYTVTRAPKISPQKQKQSKDITTGKKIDDNLQDTKDIASIGNAGTRLRKKHPKRQPKETDETNLNEIIDEIMEIPTRNSGDSVENPSYVKASLKKKASSTKPSKGKRTEEFNMDEAIEEILGIPAADSGASVENRINATRSLKKKNSTAQPSQSKDTEEMDLNEAIEEILGIPTLSDDSKQTAKPHGVSKERKANSRKNVMGESRGMATKKPTAQTTSVSDIGFPDAKASSSSVETMNCESGCSVASGDNMRPMAAGPSRVKSMRCSVSSKTAKPPSSQNTRQQPLKGKQTLQGILIKEENTLRKPRMRASRGTAEPSLGGLQGMTTHRKAAVPVTGESSTRTSPGMFYECEELELMKQIERESRCC